MHSREGFEMNHVSVRLTSEMAQQVTDSIRARGFNSASAFVRYAIQRELQRDEPAVAQAEERIVATVTRLTKEVRAVHTAQMATYTLADALVKVILTCIPEPPGEVLDQAKSRAKRRYEKFLVSVAQGMAGNAQNVIEQLGRVDD
jgi:Arc/MetJ-type ribon-helix-helix transcriptional regulator